MPAAAIRPAATTAQRGPRPSRDIRRAASRYAATIPSKPPARAVITHSVGAAELPNSDQIAVNITGSGFHDGPPLIAKLRWGSKTSRPQEIHAHGS